MSRFRQLRPAGLPRRGLALLALAALFFLMARASGAGWVVVLLCAVAALVALATVWPVVTLLRLRVELVDSPRDATARSAVTFAVRVDRAGSGVGLRLLLDGFAGQLVAAVGSSQGSIFATPPRRGVVTSATAELEAAGPLGLVTWLRRVALALPAPLEVGPSPTPVRLDDVLGVGRAAGDASFRGGPGRESVRGVRAYTAGDPIRSVHWPATARWGDVMVKEMEDPAASQLVIAVDLRGEPDRTEGAASWAAGLAGAALRAGLPVTLLTAESHGPRVGPVSSQVEVGRRLARAVADAPPPPPPNSLGTSIVRVRAA
jgi:uncharacterized protein (DUF58 family)